MESDRKRPNLIYIFADQLRRQSLGFYGDSVARTPHIDAFAADSLCLDNAVSGHPVCAPYRASLFTGKYTTSTGMVINEIRLNQNHESFANVLTRHGYETCYIGKWHLWANRLGDHFNPDNSYIPVGERLGFDDTFIGYNFHHDYYAPYAYYHGDSKEKIFYPDNAYEPDAQTDMAIEHLTRLAAGEKPFAFFLSLGTPHDPWIRENIPEKYYEMFKDTPLPNPDNYGEENDPYADDWAKLSPKEREELESWRRIYYGMVANLDDNFGRLTEAIRKLGLWENSIVIFTSDHGELFGAHGRRAKNIFYEEAVRVPFFLHGHDFAPGHCDANFNTVDIMPTLLSYMDLPIPATVEGKDKKQELCGETQSDEGSLMMGTGPTAIWGDGYEWRALRTKRYTFAVYKKDGKELLFDNLCDPGQTVNRIDDPAYADVAAALREEMYAKMASIHDNFRDNSYYRDHWAKDRILKAVLVP